MVSLRLDLAHAHRAAPGGLVTRRGQAICAVEGCEEVVAGRGFCNTHFAAHRSRMIAYGKWVPDRLPVEPVRERILALREAGIGSPRLAELTGVHLRTLENVTNHGKWVYRKTWDAVMGLEVHHAWKVAADMAGVDATGTRRRLQALAALGHPTGYVTERLGLGPTGVAKVRSGARDRVSAGRARAVAALYEELWDQSGMCDRTRSTAARNGWLLPMWWDDDTIDDPNADPCVRPDKRLTSTELITDLRGIGVTDPEEIVARAAESLGIHEDSVFRQLARIKVAS